MANIQVPVARKIYLSRRYFRPKAVHQIGAMVYKRDSEQAAVHQIGAMVYKRDSEQAAVHQIGAMVYKRDSEQAAVDFHFFCNIFIPSR